MTTLPPTPTPTLTEAAEYLRHRALLAENGPMSWCRGDIFAALVVAAEVLKDKRG